MLPESISPADLANGRAAIARAQRRVHRSADPEDTAAAEQARAEYAELKLAAHIQQTVDGWPPLSRASRDRLALLLRGGDAA